MKEVTGCKNLRAAPNLARWSSCASVLGFDTLAAFSTHILDYPETCFKNRKFIGVERFAALLEIIRGLLT